MIHLLLRLSLEQVLRPNNAVNGLRGSVANGAAGIGLLGCFRCAFVALRESLLDQLHLAVVAGGSALDQGDTRGQAHPVDMVSSRTIVQGVQDQGERLEVADTEAVAGMGDWCCYKW